MNKDVIEGKWREIKGKVKAKWGKLTDDELDQIAGNTESLRGTLQKHYGYQQEEADKEIQAFRRTLN